MAEKIIKKILMMVPILIVVSIILFILMDMLPGDAASSMAASDSTEQQIEQMREELGLNRPAYIRYLDWVWQMLHGDFGTSLITNTPVAEKIKVRLPVTLELSVLAMIVAVVIAIPTGIIAAVNRNSHLDTVSSVIAMAGVAVPHFWLAMLLIMLFSLKLGWLPASGYISFIENPGKNLTYMIMPALAIGVSFAATVMRQTRSAMLEVLGQDYIITAKSKGIAWALVVCKHALRNCLIPVVTVISMQLGRLIGGAVICETMFVMPGLGRGIIDGILSRDYPSVMGMIMIVAFFVVAINTLVDVIYIFIDPRVLHESNEC